MRTPSTPFQSTWRLVLGVLVVFGCTTTAVTGQSKDKQETTQEHVSIEYGRKAMAAGDHSQAYGHFLFGLARTTSPFEVVQLLLENSALAADADASALWAHDFYALGGDIRGRMKLKPGVSKLLPEDDDFPSSLSVSRAEAVRELMKFRDARARSKRIGDPLLAEWAEDLARQLALESPALQAEYATKLDPSLAVNRKVQRQVTRGLEKLIRNGFGGGGNDQVIRAARCLRGLGAQANFKDLEGPEPPNMSGELSTASAALARARQAMANSGVKVWSIEELEDLDEDQQRAFTLEHGSFANPGVALSPNGWYLIETNCGYWTLLGAAQTVEEHHKRLVNWYGVDPFIGIQGIVRLVPESYGLEMEGSPFWWAGGFQGGNVTTLKFTISTIPALGRGLTHELTHRFDGGAFGGLPAWLSEGRAVWTGGSYGSIYDKDFIEDYVNYGTLFGVYNDGYGEQENLEELIDGSIEEYRDNYSAGYALFVFLRSWTGFLEEPYEDENGKEHVYHDEDNAVPIFAEQLEKFMADRNRARGGAVAGFAKYFADGKDGRPADMETFARDYKRFLRGFYWKDFEPWVELYDPRAPASPDDNRRVYDEPTFTWLRNRAEPWFGQDQARVAAELFSEVGSIDDAVAAYRWCLAVDEPSDATLEQLVADLQSRKLANAAWVMQKWQRFSSPLRDYEGSLLGPAPFLEKLPRLRALLENRAAAAKDYEGRGWHHAAAAMAADHDLLATAVGVELLDYARPEGEFLHPYTRPGRHLSLGGWSESGLTGLEDNRIEGNWFVDYQDDVHVGRKTARSGTDTMDRDARGSDAFVHSLEWQDPGRYQLTAKIEQTTEYYSAGVTLGWTRRDRNIRFSFTGGDYRFATKQSEEREDGYGFGWNLNGLYARQGAKSGSVGFDRRKTTWDLRMLVDGPTVEVFVDDKYIASLTTLDARPIQGYIGFFTSTGTMRVIQPQVTRLDRELFGPTATSSGRGLHPSRKGANRMRDFIGRPVTGLPLAGAGTAILWIPGESEKHRLEMEEGEWRESVQKTVSTFLASWVVEDPSQGITVVLPESMAATDRAALRDYFAETPKDEEFVLPRGGLRWADHSSDLDITERGMTVGGWIRPLLGFADPAGIMRYHARMSRLRVSLPKELRNLLREYQDHSRPGQAGAGD
ncbi:MAG: hypothetical protein QF489_01805 [Planctomycetota bacterium]|nr:hypothetical protein [Planctomycetota bacterium]